MAAAGLGRLWGARRVSARALDLLQEDEPGRPVPGLDRPLAVRLAGGAWGALERAGRALTPGWWASRLRRAAQLAGLGRWGPQGVLGLKAACALGGATLLPVLLALAGARPRAVAVWAALGGGGGFLCPDLWLARRASARQGEIRRTLPEALDLMAIAVGAGMGLEAAVALVAQRLPGALGEELHRMLQEVQLGASRREALKALRSRTDVEELGSFALALAQADALGTPLGEVLRVQAAELRARRRQRAREEAAKVPVKLVIPLLVGIFPALGIVIMGPAVIAMVRAFGG